MSTAPTLVDAGIRPALRLAPLFAAGKPLFHIAAAAWQQHIGYGQFRDAFHDLMRGRRLAWGHVGHGPLVALQARLAETLFGGSIVGLRVLSAVGGALRVALTGLLCWSLGGRRPAQALASASRSTRSAARTIRGRCRTSAASTSAFCAAAATPEFDAALGR